MNTKMWRKMSICVAVAAVGYWTTTANAAGFLWISAPNWSYSAAVASSPAGTAYFWGLSVGPASYSWAYAFSNGGGGAAYAFAEASASNLGGQGGAQAAGIADPYAGVGIDIPLTDPSNSGGYPTSDPASDPGSSAFTVSPTGITLNSESSSELNGVDELEAFTYAGATDDSTLRSDLGAAADSGSTLSGDVTDISPLMTDLTLIPLDGLMTDPSGLSSIPFTENDSSVNPADVVLVGEGEAASDVPEPASLSLLALGGLALLRRRKWLST